MEIMRDGPAESDRHANDGLPRVAGNAMSISIVEYVERCRTLLAEEQRKPNPDNAVIAILCESVRFAREHVGYVKEGLLPNG